MNVSTTSREDSASMNRPWRRSTERLICGSIAASESEDAESGATASMARQAAAAAAAPQPAGDIAKHPLCWDRGDGNGRMRR
jgi:hypothetical protein